MISPQLTAAQNHFEAPVESSSWKALISPTQCELNHTIPGYGTARFVYQAGFKQFFELIIHSIRIPPLHAASVDFQAPKWQPLKLGRAGWSFQFNITPAQTFRFDDIQTQKLLDGLLEGLEPTFYHANNLYAKEKISASLSTVNFDAAYKDFVLCQNDLGIHSFQELAKSAIYFESGSTRLIPEAKIWLKSVAAFGRDDEIWKIELEGYTDKQGTHENNYILSRLRVETVKNFLISQGVPSEKIVTTVFGEAKPLAQNKTGMGRARNRHVSIKIYR